MRISPDGKQVAYGKGTEIHVAGVDGSGDTKVGDAFGGLQTLAW